MDRKGIFAVTLAFITLGVWYYFNNQAMEKAKVARAQVEAVAKAEAEAAAKESPATTPADPANPSTTTTPAPGVEATSVPPVEPEKQDELTTASVDYTFTNLGGGISRALLKNHEAERGRRMVLNEFGSIPIGAVTEAAGEGTNVPFTAQLNADSGEITFERTDSRKLELVKRFAVPKPSDNPKDRTEKDYIMDLDVTFTNKGTEPLTVPGYFVHTGVATPVHEKDLANYTGFKSRGGKFIDATAYEGGWFSQAHTTFTESRPEIEWAGVVNQYFTTIVTPRVEGPNAAALVGKHGVSAWTKRTEISEAQWKEAGHTSTRGDIKHYGVTGAIGMPAFTLEPGKSISQHFQIYAGPREYNRLRRLGQDQEDILGFYDVAGLFSIFSPVIGFCSTTLLYCLNTIHAWVNSYAIALILLTLTIKTLLWPMQNKATQSMKRMQLLGPKQTELREKYKEDPQRMNMEVMKLYKDYGVNPMSGCLPMLVQIPIFFGFYNMLGRAVELRNSKFLWVQDLSQPERLWVIPGVDWPINVLPLLMAGTMLWQMSLSPKSGDPMQQRMFMFMPLIFIAFCYNFASALALYWTVQNLFSVVQLYATRNQAPPTLQKVTAPPKRK